MVTLPTIHGVSWCFLVFLRFLNHGGALMLKVGTIIEHIVLK